MTTETGGAEFREGLIEAMARAGFEHTRRALPNRENLRVKGEFDVGWDELADDVRAVLIESTAAELDAAIAYRPTVECATCGGTGDDLTHAYECDPRCDGSHERDGRAICPRGPEQCRCSDGRVSLGSPRLAIVGGAVEGAWYSPTEGVVRNIEKHDALAESFGFPRASWQRVAPLLDPQGEA